MIGIPEVFARDTVAREGQAGREWIAALPGLVDGLLERWDCTPEAPVRHGQVGIVVPVRSAGLPPAVLKVSFPHPGNIHEPTAFAAWGGRGAVRLHRRDDARFALLLERASTVTLADLPDVDEAVAAAGVLAARLAVPAPPGPTGLPAGPDCPGCGTTRCGGPGRSARRARSSAARCRAG
ncbi:hypothetical protein GCM10025734_79030 [Kitasatospora paranensis]|uniref:aminoglycoside phosphotransferase family protein n=1 Tax=Kitasatospora paranensis TaxID=258053 RepID=UPI0033760664